MKVATWPVLGGAAGMKHTGSPCSWNAGQFKLLECACWHRRYVLPLPDQTGNTDGSLARFSVNRIAGELQREQFEREFIEPLIGETSGRCAYQPVKPVSNN